jgi:DNA polymerase (family X)
MAKEAEVLVSINSDAHSIAELANLKYGIGQARQGVAGWRSGMC